MQVRYGPKRYCCCEVTEAVAVAEVADDWGLVGVNACRYGEWIVTGLQFNRMISQRFLGSTSKEALPYWAFGH